MAESGKSKKIAEDIRDLSHYTEQQRLGHGKIEFDELGNALWVPYRGASGNAAINRLLNDPKLEVLDDGADNGVRRIQQNAKGLKQGYDPYDSGQLQKKQWKKKKDLRRLSQWIQSKKRTED